MIVRVFQLEMMKDKNGKYITDTFIKAKLLKESNANPEKVKSNLDKLVANALIA